MRKLGFSYKLAPRLRITPELRQALSLLQMPYPVFRQYLDQQIDENPLLQPSDDRPLRDVIEKFLQASPASMRDNSINDHDAASSSSEILEETMASSPHATNLHDYLLEQFPMTFLNEDESRLAEKLITYLDNDGYLRIPMDEFCKNENIPLKSAATVLQTIQSLEPAGVGARDLQECLLIQLRNNEEENSLAYQILQLFFKEFAKKQFAVIAQKLNVTTEAVEKTVARIKRLDPKPGQRFSDNERDLPIIPDIFVEMKGNKFQVNLNERELPALKINPHYQRLLKSADTPDEVKIFIKERLRKALWLLRAVEQRRQNTQHVMEAIFKIQKQAVLKDFSYLKPLRLRDIADRTKLHPSTVDRIISNKYLAFSGRVLRVKEFFGPHLQTEKGGMISRKNVLSRMKKLISNSPQPLTDLAIAEQLKKEGVQISRRTVTKYRGLLKLPPSFLR